MGHALLQLELSAVFDLTASKTAWDSFRFPMSVMPGDKVQAIRSLPTSARAESSRCKCHIKLSMAYFLYSPEKGKASTVR